MKGDGLCCFLQIESVELAIQILDGAEEQGSILSVSRAKFEQKVFPCRFSDNRPAATVSKNGIIVDLSTKGHFFKAIVLWNFFSRTVIDSPDLIFSTRSTSKTWGAIFMNSTSDDCRIFPPIFVSLIWPMVDIGKQILESLEVKFINSAPYVFDVDHVAKLRSRLSITVLEKKIHKIIA